MGIVLINPSSRRRRLAASTQIGYLDSDARLLVTEGDVTQPYWAGSPCACAVPLDEVPARALLVGDVVRLKDPQADRVERVVICDERVVLELRPVGLAVSDSIEVTVPSDAMGVRDGRRAHIDGFLSAR